jgi:D-glycero-D-manno-heptose 1,7-bisphosphate phosphatase
MALEKYPDIDLKDCFIVGDSICDLQLGEKLGIKTFGIGIENGKLNSLNIDSLMDIVNFI